MNFKIFIDDKQIYRVASIIANLNLQIDNYLDTRYYPPTNVDKELQLGYFVAMVAIDHRTGTTLDSFEGYVDGEFFHGADLLYRLGAKVFNENPEFFTPDYLMNLTWDRAKQLLSYNNKILWDFKVRVFLLRDLGQKTINYYSSFSKLLKTDKIEMLLNRLRIFRAYEDPVQKKSFLLAKFLYGRGLIKFRDVNNFEVAVDNHLSRIAIRLGIVRFDNYDFIEKQIEMTWKEDIKIRTYIRKAWKMVANESRINPFALDDYLWSFGRKICRQANPNCLTCLFKEICMANASKKYWWEHKHTVTWYY